jgi:hypothetical protein
MSRGQKSDASPTTSEKEKGFVGGAALTGASANNSTVSLSQAASNSIRDVALAGTKEDGARGRQGHKQESEVSSLSSINDGTASENDEFEEARDQFDQDLMQPPKFPDEEGKKSCSPVRETKFHEEIS